MRNTLDHEVSLIVCGNPYMSTLEYLLEISEKYIEMGKIYLNIKMNRIIIAYRNKHRYQLIRRGNREILHYIQKNICKGCYITRVDGYTNKKIIRKGIIKNKCLICA